ncbi:VOC family protein [Haloarchaeobius sp. HME9146]|uniref:VOC family protein n=1 Tax=Haloarchaeobius sp. HME9146 TaxID=2978732 RepID=UPI0021C010B8|nr:VOC family protein [Haloarchaeobius sp. HME9146]MCT9097045.1 VOC family protein [Haloarchaeobius sp. HME9146]
MLSTLRWLALEVKYLGSAMEFYGETLGMAERRRDESEVAYAAGDTDLVLRRPSSVPRGGVHTHYAFSIPADEYDDWWDRLADEYDLDEHVFGEARSLYLYDPDGNCVELGQTNVAGPGIDGIFEVVLEVADLHRAESFYRALGFDVVDRGENRTRIRLQGPMALELWEPHLGLADARGGLHVDLGFDGDPDAVVDAVGETARSVEGLDDGGVRILDPDGHYLTVDRA